MNDRPAIQAGVCAGLMLSPYGIHRNLLPYAKATGITVCKDSINEKVFQQHKTPQQNRLYQPS